MRQRDMALATAERIAGLGYALIPEPIAQSVLFMSGFPQKKLEESGFVSSEGSFLAKPFRKEGVAQAVRAALDGT
jgi:hypothetical protein